MENNALQYRKAADEVMKMAKEYKDKGEVELAEEIATIGIHLHNLARKKELEQLKSGSNG